MRRLPSRSRASSQLSRRSIAALLAAPVLAASVRARAAGMAAPGGPAPAAVGEADLPRARAKIDAYVDVLHATSDMAGMWRRYLAAVDPQRGPTGREARVRGLSAPAAAAVEIGAARRESAAAPAFGACDEAMAAMLRLHPEAAALLAEAAAYFARGGHRENEGAGARDYHGRLRETVAPFVGARAAAWRALEPIREAVERAELAAFERRGGRDGRWHIRRATLEARKLMAAFPEPGGIVDLERLDAAIAAFEAVVVETESFGAANPQALLAFGRSPRQFAAGMRRAQQRILSFDVTPKRWFPSMVDVEAPFQSLTRMADVMLRGAG